MAADRRTKILGQLTETLLYNSRLYVLFIDIKVSFFLKRPYIRKGLYPSGLITGGIYVFQIWWAYIRRVL